VNRPFVGTILNVPLAIIALWITAELYRGIPGTVGILLASWWSLVPLGLIFAVVWWRGARLRRRLIDEEFRDT